MNGSAHSARAKGNIDEGRVELTLLRAPDDAEQFSDEIQAELFGIHDTLNNRGVGVTSFGWHPAGDTHIGQFLITAWASCNCSNSSGHGGLGTSPVRTEGTGEIWRY